MDVIPPGLPPRHETRGLKRGRPERAIVPSSTHFARLLSDAVREQLQSLHSAAKPCRAETLLSADIGETAFRPRSKPRSQAKEGASRAETSAMLIPNVQHPQSAPDAVRRPSALESLLSPPEKVVIPALSALQVLVPDVLQGTQPWKWGHPLTQQCVDDVVGLCWQDGQGALSDEVLGQVLSLNWTRETPERVQYLVAEQMESAVVEVCRVYCLQQVLEARRAAVAQHEAALRDVIALADEATDTAALAQGLPPPPTHDFTSRPVALRLAHLALLDAKSACTMHALALKQAAEVANTSVALAAHFSYSAHGVMCLLTQVQGQSWVPERDDVRLARVASGLTPELVRPLLSCLGTTPGQTASNHWLGGVHRSTVGQGLKPFLAAAASMCLRRVQPILAGTLSVAGRHSSLLQASMVHHSAKLHSLVQRYQWDLLRPFTEGLPPPTTILDHSAALSTKTLEGSERGVEAVAEAEGLASALSSALPPSVADMVQSALAPPRPPAPLQLRGVAPAAGSGAGGVRHAVPGPQAYPPSAWDGVEKGAGGGVAYPREGPSAQEVERWMVALLDAVGVPSARHHQAQRCVMVVLQAVLEGGARALRCTTPPPSLRTLPRPLLTPASWRALLLGCTLAWCRLPPPRTAHLVLEGEGVWEWPGDVAGTLNLALASPPAHLASWVLRWVAGLAPLGLPPLATAAAEGEEGPWTVSGDTVTARARALGEC